MRRQATSIEERFDRGGLWAAIVVMVAWHFGSVLPSVISGWSLHGLTASGVVAWPIFAVIGVCSAWLALRGQGNGWLYPLTACLVLLVGVAVVSLASPEGFFGRYNWPFSQVGWFALVTLWRRGLAELVAFFVSNTFVGAAMLVALHETDRVSIARFLMLSCGVSAMQITLFVGSRAVASMARQGAVAEETLARTQTERLAAEAVQTARLERYEMIRGTVVPLLEGLAKGTLDLVDSGTQQQVRVAVTRLRRYLVENDDVPDPLSHELRACVDAAERRGIAVDLQAPAGNIPPMGVEIRRALSGPVIDVLAATATQARVTVVATPTEVVIGIVADADSRTSFHSTNAEVRINDDADGGRLWVEARWTAPSPSLS